MEFPEHLSEAARLVIGLTEIGIDSGEAMADLLGMVVPDDATVKLSRRITARRAMFLAFVREVRDSQDQIIMECLRWGLPVQCAQSLPEGVRVKCRGCGAKLNSVPCQHCGRKLLFEIPKDGRSWQTRKDTPMREPATPTEHLPGSKEKIEVMRQRVEAGELPCHPDDRQVNRPIVAPEIVTYCHFTVGSGCGCVYDDDDELDAINYPL